MNTIKLSYHNIKTLQPFFQKLIKLITIFSLSLTLTLTWTPKTLGQISLFTSPPDPRPTQAAPWDLNQAYACGRFWCSDVYIYDDSRRLQTELLTPELMLATLKELDQTNIEAAQALEKRAKLVQQVFNQVFDRIVKNKIGLGVPYISDWKFWLPTSLKELWYSAKLKPPHPCIPDIEIGTKNRQTVIFIPNQFDLGIASQSIVTVTDIDAKANGTTVEELAQRWRQTILLSFSNALWGHEFDRQYPGWRSGIAGIIIVISLLLIWFVELLQSSLRKWNNQLKQKLNKLTENLTINPEVRTNKNIENNVNDIQNDSELRESELSEQQNTLIKDSKKQKIHFPLLWNNFWTFVKKIIRKNKWLYSKLRPTKQKFTLRRQTLIKQKINFCQLVLRMEFIIELLILVAALILITLIFRQTRFFSVYLLKETLRLLAIWIGLTVIDKLGDFAIDYYLNRWASEAQVNNPNSNRYTLRVNTYSVTLKQATTFITIVIGIYLSIWIIGINPSILAGAGIFAVAIAFLSRNLLEDMLNGILILCSDRYAIGDVIDVGNGMAGFVEDINLFVTSLRNLDGQLIAIPNSKISTVINNTKDWSRVNFTIKIAWNEDIKKAIDIMVQVANQMQSEPEWGDKFLEPVEVLGVDEVSHEGILIRLLIKTKPIEQWGIGREFRLRVKQAFDEAGIKLGIPYHKISVVNPDSNTEQLSTYFLSEKKQ